MLDQIASDRIGATIELELAKAFVGKEMTLETIEDYERRIGKALDWVHETLANTERSIKWYYQG